MVGAVKISVAEWYLKKAVSDMPLRVPPFFLRLLKYDYTIVFIPGKQMALTDMLSRSPAPGDGTAVDNTDVEVHAVSVVSSHVSKRTALRLTPETACDPYLKLMLQKVNAGEALERPLASASSELSVVNGILLKGTKIVIPTRMRVEMLQRIHAGHLGIRKCNGRARQLVFWPNINSDIEALIQKCAVCKRRAYNQPAQPLMLRATTL